MLLVDILKILATFGGFYFFPLVLQRKGVDYSRKFYILAAYYLLASSACFLIFKGLLIPYFSDFTSMPFVALAFSALALFLLSPAINSKLKIPEKVTKKYRKAFIFNFDRRFIMAKIPDVAFQQVFILALLLTMVSNGLSANHAIVLFGIVFILLHFTLLPRMGDVAFFHVFLSAVASFIFPVLVLRVNYGIVYSFSLHLLGYLAFRVLLWHYYSNRRGP
jgi:hypothetical protein